METDKPRPKSDMKCPLWRKPMREVCHECEWWIHVRGKHPQSGEVVDHWGCAVAWMPVLMIENSQQQRQTGAAVESFRNEMLRLNQEAYRAIGISQAGPNNGGGGTQPQIR